MMPRNVRNFWIETAIDGGTPIGTGSRHKEGEFDLTIKQRHLGGVTTSLHILGRADPEGKLTLTVRRGSDNGEIERIETVR
jgi:hypothetical protein